MSTLTSMCQKPKAVLYFVIQILKKKEMNATVKYWNQAAAISAVTLECLSLVFNLLPELIFFWVLLQDTDYVFLQLSVLFCLQ